MRHTAQCDCELCEIQEFYKSPGWGVVHAASWDYHSFIINMRRWKQGRTSELGVNICPA